MLNETIEQEDSALPVETIVYELDIHNNIVAINGFWQSFAIENNAPELTENQVIGKPLMEFISGNITKEFWQSLIDKARSVNEALLIDYRCDSPDLRRFMQIKLYRGENERLHFESALLRTEARPVSIHFKRAHQRGANTKVRCSFCNHILHKNGWVEAEALVTGSQNVTMDVIYGICPVCKSALDTMNVR